MKTNLTAAALALFLAACAHNPSDSIPLAAQGSFTVGGGYVAHPGTFKAGKLHCPRRPALRRFCLKYQAPTNAKPLPLIFQHGGARSSRTWESTVDGRGL